MELAGGDVAGAVGFDLDLDIAVVDFADDCGSFAAVRTANDVVADFADHDCGGFAAVHVANVAVADDCGGFAAVHVANVAVADDCVPGVDVFAVDYCINSLQYLSHNVDADCSVAAGVPGVDGVAVDYCVFSPLQLLRKRDAPAVADLADSVAADLPVGYCERC